VMFCVLNFAMEEVLKADPKCIKAVEEYETDIRTVYGVLDRALHSLNSLMVRAA
jgi:hypothetical protein